MSKTNSKKKYIIIISISLAVILIALAVGGYFLTKDTKSDTVQTQNSDQLRQEINNLVSEKKYDEAAGVAKKLPGYENKSRDSLLTLATVYINADKSQEAINIFLEIEKNNEMTYGDAENTASLYAKLEDKDKATEYYRKAADLMQKSDNPMKDDEVTRLQRLAAGDE